MTEFSLHLFFKILIFFGLTKKLHRFFWRREESSPIPPTTLPPASSLRGPPNPVVGKRDAANGKEKSTSPRELNTSREGTAENGGRRQMTTSAAGIPSGPATATAIGSATVASTPLEPSTSPPLIGKLLGIAGTDAAVQWQIAFAFDARQWLNMCVNVVTEEVLDAWLSKHNLLRLRECLLDIQATAPLPCLWSSVLCKVRSSLNSYLIEISLLKAWNMRT